MEEYFFHDERLGILLPKSNLEWKHLSNDVQQSILMQWETNRGSIPDRIADLENHINRKQAQLYEENNFHISCQLNEEIADLASIINDLWLWFRINQQVTQKIDF
jgi:gas vesicle protein